MGGDRLVAAPNNHEAGGTLVFTFALPWILALWPLPFIIRKLLPRSPQAALWLPQQDYLVPTASSGQKRRWSWLLPILIWSLLIGAAAQPRWLDEPIPLNPEAREIMIALDLSGSMEMDDMTLNGRRATRLEAAHKILSDFIRRRSGDRIGLIVYADDAYVYVPITSDLNTVATLAEEASIGLAGQRTALGDAIGLAIKYFEDRPSDNKVVLMLTDGMINAGVIDANAAIHLAANHDVKIHTIGIGSDEMVVQGLFGERRINPSTDLDEQFLTTIAQVSGGRYFRGRSTEEMEEIYQIIDEIEPIAAAEQYFRPFQSLAAFPLAAALFFLRSCSFCLVFVSAA